MFNLAYFLFQLALNQSIVAKVVRANFAWEQGTIL